MSHAYYKNLLNGEEMGTPLIDEETCVLLCPHI